MTTPMSPRFLVHPSPIGDVLIVTTDDGVVTLHPFDGPLGAELERVGLALRELPLPVEADASAGLAHAAATQLDEYFEGDRREFDLPLDEAHVLA